MAEQNRNKTPTVGSLRGGGGRGSNRGSPGKGHHGRGSNTGRGRGNPGRASPNRGRGRGRGSPPKKGPPPLHVETVDFLRLHAMVGASKYKVHKPQCECPKMQLLRSRPIRNETQNDEDDLAQQMNQLNLSNENATTQMDSIMDNLTVVADTQSKNSPAVFVCTETSSEIYTKDPRGCERKLQKDIFGDNPNITDKMEAQGSLPPFKVSCAVCLLKEDPNGFVCMTSNSLEPLREAIKAAKKTAEQKENEPGGLHSDHADFVAALEVQSLQKLLKQPKAKEAKQAVLLQLHQQDVPKVDCLDQNGVLTNDDAKIKIGHHLSTLLKMMETKDNTKYWSVLGYKTGPCDWFLDLPGGKRHLGESTLDCAVRETEEECSIVVTKDWLSGKQTTKLHDGECNMFYLVEPMSTK